MKTKMEKEAGDEFKKKNMIEKDWRRNRLRIGNMRMGRQEKGKRRGKYDRKEEESESK